MHWLNNSFPGFYWAESWVQRSVHCDGHILFIILLELKSNGNAVGQV